MTGAEVTPPFLEKKYAEELKNRKRDEAYFDYWFRLVKNYQNKVRLKDFSHCELESTQFKTPDLEDFFSILSGVKMGHQLGLFFIKVFYVLYAHYRLLIT